MTLKEKRIYGLVGFPVKHSLSALMHNAAFQALKINAEYKLFELKLQDLEAFLKSLLEKNIYGLNVTIPYKEIVLPFLNSLSDEARLIGAVNTIKVLDTKLEGFNTDGEGFLKHLRKDLGFNPKSKLIAIIGAGGAARAVSIYLAKHRPKIIAIYDIDKTKVLGLIRHLKENFNNVDFKQVNSVEELNIQTSDLLINATPIGMKETDPCLVNDKFLHKDLLVYDLIYNPKQTKLIKIAKLKGAATSNGLGMLLYQGALSFRHFTGKPAPIKIMSKALSRGVNKL